MNPFLDGYEAKITSKTWDSNVTMLFRDSRTAMSGFCISQTVCAVLTTNLISNEIFLKFIPIIFCS